MTRERHPLLLRVASHSHPQCANRVACCENGTPLHLLPPTHHTPGLVVDEEKGLCEGMYDPHTKEYTDNTSESNMHEKKTPLQRHSATQPHLKRLPSCPTQYPIPHHRPCCLPPPLCRPPPPHLILGVLYPTGNLRIQPGLAQPGPPEINATHHIGIVTKQPKDVPRTHIGVVEKHDAVGTEGGGGGGAQGGGLGEEGAVGGGVPEGRVGGACGLGKGRFLLGALQGFQQTIAQLNVWVGGGMWVGGMCGWVACVGGCVEYASNWDVIVGCQTQRAIPVLKMQCEVAIHV